MQRLLIIDNDVLNCIFISLKESNPVHFDTAIQQLSLRYDVIWIPEEVENEFCYSPKGNKNRKLLQKIYDTHQFITQCPIKVSAREIDLDNNHSSGDRGETDAILQVSKLLSVVDKKYKFSQVHLFFKDKGAIRRAKNKNLNILLYKDFAIELREIGVNLQM